MRQARSPVVVTSAAGRDPAAVPLLGKLASDWASPSSRVLRAISTCRTITPAAARSPLPCRLRSGAAGRGGDLLLVVECDVPWLPQLFRPRDDARITHLGTDPLFQRYPMRTFRADLHIPGELAHSLKSLSEHLGGSRPSQNEIEARRRRLARSRSEAEPAADDGPLTFEAASRAVHDLVDEETVVFNEYPLRLARCPITRPGGYFGFSPAGGLGWGLGAALGYKMAAPESFVIATLGDGAYIFANPIAGHTVAAAENLSILTIILNDRRYGAVRNATLAMYGQGAAAADEGLLLARLDGTPCFADIVRAHGGHGETVDDRHPFPTRCAVPRRRCSAAGSRPSWTSASLPSAADNPRRRLRDAPRDAPGS